MFKDLMRQVISQGNTLERLLNRTVDAQSKLKDAADRVYYSVQDAFTFVQGQNVVQNLVFNIPQSEDFEAVRLSFYPYIRRTSFEALPAGTTPDLVFRPTQWTFQHIRYQDQLIRYATDALLELTTASPDGKTRSYQNAAFFVYQTFSAYTTPIAPAEVPFTNFQMFDRSESPSALIFDPAWKLTKGSTVTARITPLFSGERDPAFADGLVNEYQIRGVLEGYKRVR